MATRFKAPAVAIGETVQWFRSKDSPPQAAVVIGGGNGCSVSLAIFEPFGGLMARSGAKHVDDPEADKAVQADEGLWDLVPHYNLKFADPDAPFSCAESAA